MKKNSPVMQGTWVRSLGWEDPLGVGNGYPLQYSCLDNSIDRGAWQAVVHGVTKSQTQLSDFHFNFSSHGKQRIVQLQIASYSVHVLF